MNKHNQYKVRGFAHVITIVFIFVLVAIGAAGYVVLNRSSQDDENLQNNNQSLKDGQSLQDAPSAQKVSDEQIKLINVGIDIASGVVISKDALRDYDRGLKGFYIFGDKLSENRTNPNLEFSSVKADAPIIASINGEVAHIQQQTDTNDYEVFLKTSANSPWTIGYDHLVGLTVKKGDKVKVGDKLGTAAVQNNGLYRFEMQVNKDIAGVTEHICPSSLLAADVVDGTLSSLRKMMEGWNQLSGKSLYDVAAQNPVGCTKISISVAEAEGR